jgi:ABC-type multidrug transport system fused ATPase/permease subunit
MRAINDIFFFLLGLLTFIDISLVTRLGENVSLRLRNELYDSILRQDMAFFDIHMQGEVVGRLTQDVAEFKVRDYQPHQEIHN